MDDNIIMEPYSIISGSDDTTSGGLVTSSSNNGELNLWRPSHILDFGNMSVGGYCLFFASF